MPTLLIVHHTPSPNCQAMFEAVVSGATAPEIEGVRVVRRAALSATAGDVLDADGYLLGTPANLGYMSGALKHFFDQVYYPCLDTTKGRPFGYYVHGGNDVTGAVRGIESVTAGLGWAPRRRGGHRHGGTRQGGPGALLGAGRDDRGGAGGLTPAGPAVRRDLLGSGTSWDQAPSIFSRSCSSQARVSRGCVYGSSSGG